MLVSGTTELVDAGVGRIGSINVSGGGLPKRPVAEADVTTEGVEGDWQSDRRYHGGPDRAVVIFSAERIAALQAEGHPIGTGTTGENLTLSGLDWTDVVPGARLEVVQDSGHSVYFEQPGVFNHVVDSFLRQAGI